MEPNKKARKKLIRERWKLQLALRRLPQELWDEIHKLIFQPPPGLRVVDANYKPPVMLQVSSALRTLFACTYYGNGSVFQIEKATAEKWMDSLPCGYTDLIDEVKIVGPGYEDPVQPGFTDGGLVRAPMMVRTRGDLPTPVCVNIEEEIYAVYDEWHDSKSRIPTTVAKRLGYSDRGGAMCGGRYARRFSPTPTYDYT